MQIADSILMFAPLRRVWASLDDPVILSACIPENDGFVQFATHTFIAHGRIKTGPMRARITVEIRIAPTDPPHHATIYLNAHGAIGKAEAVAEITFTEGASHTRLDYSAAIQFTGAAGRLAGRFGEQAAKDLVRDFFARLAHAIPHKQPALDEPVTEAQTKPVIPPKRTLPWAEEPRWRKTAAWIGGGAAAALATAAAAILWTRRKR